MLPRARGLAAGSGALTGFPLVWSQNIKDVTLVHVGGSYRAIIDIAKKATEDLGFKVEMQTAPHDALLNRLLTQPNTIDIADTEYFFQYYMIKKGTLQPIDLEKRFKWWDKVVPIFTKGEYPGRAQSLDPGLLPYKVQYVDGPGAKDFAKGPTKWATGVPDRVQRGHAGHPAGPSSEDRQLGASCSIRSSRVRPPSCRCPRSASWTPPWRIEARGDIKYGDKGDMTKAEIDKTIEILIEG